MWSIDHPGVAVNHWVDFCSVFSPFSWSSFFSFFQESAKKAVSFLNTYNVIKRFHLRKIFLIPSLFPPLASCISFFHSNWQAWSSRTTLCWQPDGQMVLDTRPLLHLNCPTANFRSGKSFHESFSTYYTYKRSDFDDDRRKISWAKGIRI